MRMLARVEGMPLESLEAGVPWDWRSFGEYLDRLDGQLAVNAGFLVGHSALRRVVMGEDASRAARPTPTSSPRCARLLAESLDGRRARASRRRGRTTHNDADGDPVPSRHATREELVALCARRRRPSRHDARVHPRRSAASRSEHIELMAAMSAAANRPLNWNVLASSAPRRDHVHEQLAAGDYAAERGGRVLALTVPERHAPHLSFKTGFVLDALPGWRQADGAARRREDGAAGRPRGARAARRAGRLARGRVLRRAWPAWDGHDDRRDLRPENQGLAGRMVGDIAAERGQEPFDALLRHRRRRRAAHGVQAAGAATTTASVGAAPRGVARPARRRRRVRRRRAPRHAVDVQLTPRRCSQACARARAAAARGGGALPHRRAGAASTACASAAASPRAGTATSWCSTPTPSARADRHGATTCPAGAGRLYGGAEGIEHVLVNGTEIVRGRRGHRRDAGRGAPLRSRHRHRRSAPIVRWRTQGQTSAPSSTPT